MKILWFSNKVFDGKDIGNTGTWLDAMVQRLVANKDVELCNVTAGNVKAPTQQDVGPITQWIVPAVVPRRDGLPPADIVTEIVKIVADFSPRLIHIWGTENYWGLLTTRNLIQHPTLLEIQGLKFAIAKNFRGGLSFKEQMSCVGLKEIIRGATIYQGCKRFERWGVFEKEMIAHHHFIAVQTEWVDAQVKAINADCQTFHTDLILRNSFYDSAPWHFKGNFTIFCSAAYSSPFKGLHVAVRAVAQLKNRFPNIMLRIAGAHQSKGIRQDGYIRWINQQITKLGIEKNVHWLGSLTADSMIKEMTLASAMLIPTYIENCCTSMQEAMVIGIPIVASYTGGLPSIASDEESVLFFSPGDEAMCAHQLERVLTNRELATRLSQQARAVAVTRNDPAKVLNRQLEIYRQVLSESDKV